MMISLPMVVFAATIEVYPEDDAFAAMQMLQAGDELVMHAGTYKVPGFVELTLNGEETQPIVIRGAEGELVIIEGVPDQNTLNLTGTWYTLRDLEITGGSHGLRLGTSAHVVLENLHIHHVGDVGVSCNRDGNSYEAITIRRVHIHDTGLDGGPGECMYLGCNEGLCKVWDSLVEFNWCHDTLAGSQGDGIEFKTGSYNTIVRHNVVHDVKYPGITMYGTQGMPQNTVEGNAVWNVEDNGIQTVGDVMVRNNLIANVGASGIAAKSSQGEVVQGLSVLHNTVVGAGDACMRGNDFPAGAEIVIANNAFYCEGGTAIKLAQGMGPAIVVANAVLGAVEGAEGTVDGGALAAAFVDAGALQFYLAPGSPLIDTGEPKYCAAEDFNCLLRHGPVDIGAYEVSTPDNPGWVVGPGFKECAVESGGETDGETDGETGAETGGESGAETGEQTGGETGTPTGSATESNDAGTADAGTDATPTGTGGATLGDATTDATDSGGQDDGSGCSCRSDAAPTPGLLLGVIAGLGLSRRRRR
jgi:MYXO-CTERM domain-containing protein